MPAPNRLQHLLIKRVGPYLHPIWSENITEPIFVVGCPRSGTTVLADILSHHSRFFYLFEPMYIWRHKYPQYDIWGPGAKGKLYLDERDNDVRYTGSIRRWLSYALFIGMKPRLLEKNPLHVFRIRWLLCMFPDAKIIHIYRHGRDVALSLLQAIPRWHGFHEKSSPLDYWASQWNYYMFEKYAKEQEPLVSQLDYVKSHPDHYNRTLLVWLSCVHEARRALQLLGNSQIYELSYENLVNNVDTEVTRLFTFLNEYAEKKVRNYAKDTLHERSIEKPDPNPDATSAIAGYMLEELGY